MCMSTTPAPAAATVSSIAGSWRPAETSFTTVAPAVSAARATAALVVSTETVTVTRAARPSITGTTRASSVSRSTANAPGRVDSPPTSSTVAPAATRATPCARAASTARKRPPSEKESGVTLTIPITARRGRQATENGTAAGYRRSAARHSEADHRHGLRTGGRALLEDAANRRRDGHRAGLADAPHRHAQVLGFDHHERAARLECVDQRVGHLGGEALLY